MSDLTLARVPISLAEVWYRKTVEFHGDVLADFQIYRDGDAQEWILRATAKETGVRLEERVPVTMLGCIHKNVDAAIERMGKKAQRDMLALVGVS